MNIKDKILKRQQKLRLQIENMKVTQNKLPVLNFDQNSKRIFKRIAQKERELAMLESHWKL